jgi:hypothetical protein
VSGLRENALRIYWWASVCAIAFAFGLAIGVFKVFPYRLLQDMAYAARELARYPLHTLRISPEKFVAESPPEGSGVVRHVAGKPVPGVTLVAGFFEGETGIRLIDLDGAVLNEWRISYNAIWPESPHLGDQPQDWDTELHGAMLLPDGGVVFTFQYGGLIRMDRCSRVEWKLPRQTHHLFSADADGNFWVPGREERREALPRFPKVEPVFQEDFLLKVSPDGVVLQEISILDAIFSSGLEGLLFANGMHDTELSKPLDGDFTHLNDIEVLTPALAPAFPMFEAGDLLVSLRNLNLLLVVDPGTGRVKWKRSGSFLRQHDPDFLPAGRIVLFDNRRDKGDARRFGGSRIVSIDPGEGSDVTLYGRLPGEDFYTDTQGDQQMLGNGNILVTESNEGRVFEVDADGNVVWSYVNRWTDGPVGIVTHASRYPGDYLNESPKEPCNDPTKRT